MIPLYAYIYRVQQVKALVLEDMVVEALMADADVSDEALSYEELMKLQQQQPGM